MADAPVQKPYSRTTPDDKGVSVLITGSYTPEFTPTATTPDGGSPLVYKIQRPEDVYSALENPFHSWGGAVAMVNSLIYGPTLVGYSGELSDVPLANNWLSFQVGNQEGNDGSLDGNLWLGPTTLALPATNYKWTQKDIIAARNYRRKLLPEIIFKKISRKWDEKTIIDLLKPWWVYQNVWLTATDSGFIFFSIAGQSDRPSVAAGPSSNMQLTGQCVIDLDDDQGPFHYNWTTKGCPTGAELLARWNLEDIFEDEENPLERGTVFPPLFESTDTLGLEFSPSTRNQQADRRMVLCNGIDGIVRDETITVLSS